MVNLTRRFSRALFMAATFSLLLFVMTQVYHSSAFYKSGTGLTSWVAGLQPSISSKLQNPSGSDTGIPKNPKQESSSESGSKVTQNSSLLGKMLGSWWPSPSVKSREIMALDFYKGIFTIFDDFRPNVKPLTNYTNGEPARSEGWDKIPKDPLTNEYLGKFLQVEKDDVFELNRCHQGVVDHLPREYPQHLYKGNGVVIVAGGKFMPMAIASVKVLRDTGSNLPVEIFLANNEEYEPKICEKILRQLNARCVILPEAIGKGALNKFPLKRYQFKALSLLASSFENVLLMDADNYLLKNPEFIFEQDPFSSKGYVFWSDYWRRATSPYYYQVAGVQLGPRVRNGDPSDKAKETPPAADLEHAIPDPSCESGQLLVSKRMHYKAIILSVYYNLFGPDIYYPLLSQGSSGEGDKETFIAGPVFFQEPFYQVSQFIWTLGFVDSSGFHGTAMSQYDPVEDYAYAVLKTRKEVSTPLFVHNHMPKLNPPENVKNGDFFNKDGERVRILGDRKGSKDSIPVDLELLMWQAAQFMVCEMKAVPNAWADEKENIASVCDEVKEQVKFLIQTSE
ncbi:nucleotide-diphospho-sugar transferase [Nadsonia fulvescens var. elongata DSM 6958]|uniref:Nucleotide-diphospho-sugar transferase n=1 Tax=Nadsonia fulvescens var. elongata DSM 6958 TaxID=857566 RepID=A0A1E3PED1_9ASCO|nr:nucleotide-diphospho-sugar transferase [Nadsonia fulvescens var. elongata DSM 6958]